MGAIAAYVFQAELRTGNLALLIVGVSATLNFAAYFFQGRRSMARLCMVASPIIGVGGWTAVITITGGVSSPFIAGLWLEVVLSAMALRPRGIVLVTLGSATALGLQQLRVGLEALAEDFGWIGQVRGMGLMQAMELVKDRGSKEPFAERTGAFMEAAKDEGLLIGKAGLADNVLRFGPSLLVTEDEVADALGRTRRVCTALDAV